ncbi:MAG: hypothetical protein QOK44_1940 [Betaproteobacteria bacterium]|nr:hypothetical protein [Betaproteobacteria bacterium]
MAVMPLKCWYSISFRRWLAGSTARRVKTSPMARRELDQLWVAGRRLSCQEGWHPANGGL